jgi:hypothetical protein
MGESFTLGGDPASIRSSATVWGTFGTDASTASADVTSLDTSEFQGDEADTYRDKVNDDLPPRLNTTSQAWQVVSAALNAYAGTLEDLQSRMSTLKARAADQSDKVGSAQSALTSARSADSAHTRSRQAAAEKLEPGETLPADTYHGQTSGASSSLSSAQQALQGTIDAAATVRSEHTQALDACCNEIDRAKKMRFADPPGFWGKLGQSVGDWIKDRADVLKAISSVLKTISGIAGMLALIPCLAPIMGPIALVAGGVALGIDVAVKLATGEGSWLQIGVDALSMIPGARAAKVAFGASVAVTGYNISQGDATWADMAMVVGMGALGSSKVTERISNSKLVQRVDYGLQYGAGAVRNRMSYEVGAFRNGMSNAWQPSTVAAMPNGMTMNTGLPQFSGAAFRTGRADYVHTIDVQRYPETAAHVHDAQNGTIWQGSSAEAGPAKPDVLTINRPGADSNRAAWQQQYKDTVPTQSGFDRDEYPPAMFAEGGRDASVKYISPSDNRGAGSTMGWELRSAGLPNGASVRIVAQ